MGYKLTSDTDPSPAEKDAQAWHVEQHPVAHLECGCEDCCYCRCGACSTANPYYRAARVEARKDIFNRIADSVATARLPDQRDEL